MISKEYLHCNVCLPRGFKLLNVIHVSSDALGSSSLPGQCLPPEDLDLVEVVSNMFLWQYWWRNT